MAYRQYTSCVKPGNFLDLGFSYLGWVGFTAGAVTFVIAGIAAGAALPAVVPALIAILVVLISFLIWWLYGRLICLGGEQCLIGMVLGRGQPQPLTKAGDDDATMNVLLAPGPTDKNEPKEEYWANPIQGFLVKPNDAILAVGRGYAEDEDHLRYVKHLHCEFEGSGIHNVLIWASEILALLIAALLVPFPINVILLILAAIFSALFTWHALGSPYEPGDPADIDSNLGILAAGHIVVVKGDWIYDSLHAGWNEIHAVHACQIIGKMSVGGPWPADLGGGFGLDTPEKTKAAIGHWCLAIKEAEDAEEGGSKNDPANNWVIHPLIDGCKPPPIIL